MSIRCRGNEANITAGPGTRPPPSIELSGVPQPTGLLGIIPAFDRVTHPKGAVGGVPVGQSVIGPEPDHFLTVATPPAIRPSVITPVVHGYAATVSLFRINVRLSGQHKCHSVRVPWYQMMALRGPPRVAVLVDLQRPCIS